MQASLVLDYLMCDMTVMAFGIFFPFKDLKIYGFCHYCSDLTCAMNNWQRAGNIITAGPKILISHSSSSGMSQRPLKSTH